MCNYYEFIWNDDATKGGKPTCKLGYKASIKCHSDRTDDCPYYIESECDLDELNKLNKKG